VKKIVKFQNSHGKVFGDTLTTWTLIMKFVRSRPSGDQKLSVKLSQTHEFHAVFQAIAIGQCQEHSIDAKIKMMLRQKGYEVI